MSLYVFIYHVLAWYSKVRNRLAHYYINLRRHVADDKAIQRVELVDIFTGKNKVLYNFGFFQVL